MYCSLTINTLIFGKIKYVKDEIVTSTGFTNATPHVHLRFIYLQFRHDWYPHNIYKGKGISIDPF